MLSKPGFRHHGGGMGPPPHQHLLPEAPPAAGQVQDLN